MNLLVLGNGFDMKCGLASSFFDYISAQLDKHPFLEKLCDKSVLQSQNEFDQYFHDHLSFFKEISFIELYTYVYDYSFNNSWADFEKTIFKLLQVGDDKKYTPWEKIYIGILEMLRDQSHTFIIDSKIKRYENIIGCVFLRLYSIDNLDSFYETIYSLSKWYDFLFEEVKKFEKSFMNYLNADFDKKKNTYNEESIRNISKLLGTSSLTPAHLLNTIVISFNYTELPDIIKNNVVNIHGKLSNNSLIIGIDSTKMKFNEKTFKFTKTYRKFDLVSSDKHNREINYLKETINNIIFYGHSLNEQDYAYFQTLFDAYGLFENKDLHLTFYYSIHGTKSIVDLKAIQVNRIVKLIETYGDTLLNKHIGKNLFHRLLLQQRIHLYIID